MLDPLVDRQDDHLCRCPPSLPSIRNAGEVADDTRRLSGIVAEDPANALADLHGPSALLTASVGLRRGTDYPTVRANATAPPAGPARKRDGRPAPFGQVGPAVAVVSPGRRRPPAAPPVVVRRSSAAPPPPGRAPCRESRTGGSGGRHSRIRPRPPAPPAARRPAVRRSRRPEPPAGRGCRRPPRAPPPAPAPAPSPQIQCRHRPVRALRRRQ